MGTLACSSFTSCCSGGGIGVGCGAGRFLITLSDVFTCTLVGRLSSEKAIIEGECWTKQPTVNTHVCVISSTFFPLLKGASHINSSKLPNTPPPPTPLG